MRSRLLLTCSAILAVILGVLASGLNAGRAAAPHQTGGTATATTTPAATSTATVAPSPTLVPTQVPTPTAAPTSTPVGGVFATPQAVGEVLPAPVGVSARFTVSFTSATPGAGRVYFGTSCNGLVEVSTRDRNPGTTQHVVTVVGNDLPGSVGNVGITPGATYYYAVATVSSTGKETIDNNGGKCYSVTIPTTAESASTRVLTATLLGANETGGGAPNGRGFATITINTSTNTLCYSLTVSGITLPALASHIHRGAAGVAGPIVVPFPNPPNASGTSSGCVSVDPALLADILANPSNYYVNVHSVEFPGGAVRGQLGTSRVLSTRMTGSQETPPTNVTGSGTATITVDTSNNSVCYTLIASGITLPALAAHIHKGPPGVAGPIVVPLTAPDQYGVATGCTTVAASLAQDLILNPGSYYVNVHTTEFPAGAIRGQLTSGNVNAAL